MALTLEFSGPTFPFPFLCLRYTHSSMQNWLFLGLGEDQDFQVFLELDAPVLDVLPRSD